jgi:hypothetical protein
MATLICFPHNVIDNEPIFTKEKPWHFVATAFFFVSRLQNFAPNMKAFKSLWDFCHGSKSCDLGMKLSHWIDSIGPAFFWVQNLALL